MPEEQPRPPQRIELAVDLQSRDGTLTYDGHITNGYVEKTPVGFRIYQRSGLSQLVDVGYTTGQGITNFVDVNGTEQLYVLGGGALYGASSTSLPTSAASDTWTSGASPGGNGTQPGYFTFNNKLWCLSAASSGTPTVINVYVKDTPSTSAWTLYATDITGGSARYGGVFLIYNRKVFWIPTGGDAKVEVWSSSNCSTWTRLTTSPGWSADAEQQLLVYDNKMWYLGGFIVGTGAENVVYNSTDGTTWTSVQASPAYGSGRRGFFSTVANGKMWVMGGIVSSTYKNDVYYSTDGSTWTAAAATAPFVARSNANIATLGNTMLVVGGAIDNTTISQISYSSTDGATWTQQQTTTLGTSFWIVGGVPYPNSFMLGNTLVIAPGSTGGSQTGHYGYVTPTGTGGISTVSTNIGAAPSGFADFATDYSRSQLMIRCDTAAYKFDPATYALTLITDADYPAQTVRGCVYLDGTFYVMDLYGTIYGSDIDDCTSWNALNFISAEFDSDPGVFLGKVGPYVVAFGTQTYQFFWDAANATGSPLSPVQSGVTNIGCAHGFSVQQMEDSVIWMAQRKASGTSFQKGRFIAMLDKSMGYKVVSTPDVDRVLNADDLATIYSCVYSINGHNFYSLVLGTSGITLFYDLTTGLWGNWTRSTAASAVTLTSLTQSGGTATATKSGHGFSDGDQVVIAGATPSGYNGTFNVTVTSSSVFTFPVSSSLATPATGTITATGSTESYFDMVASCSLNGDQVFQDESGGIIWKMLPSNLDDNGVSINFKCRTAKRDYGNNKRKFSYGIDYIGNVSASTDVGLLRYTDDDYATYSYYRQFDLTEVLSNQHRWGNYRRRAWEWRHTRSLAHYIDALEEDVKQGDV